MAPPDPTTDATLLAVISTLRAELDAQREERARTSEDLALARREISRLVAMVEGLTRQLDTLLRDHDEARRAELARMREEAKAALQNEPPGDSGDADALEDEGSGADDAGSDPSNASDSSGTRHNHGRSPIPPHIPRQTTQLHPDSCGTCGGDHLDEKKVLTSEEWDYVRAHLRARRIERTMCVCRDCGNTTTPEQPPMPFDRVSCTFAMMAWLCFAKAGLFLPLDRVQRDFEDQGAHLASSTLTRWQQRGADLLRPVAAAVRLALLDCTHIRTDGTGLLVVFPRVKGKPVKGEARPGAVDGNGYLLPRVPNYGQILVFGNDEQAVYHYTPTRHGYHALDFLTVGVDADGEPLRWSGTLTADALSAHDCLFASGDRVESGCNAHGLRKFRDDADKAPLLASRALAYVGRFFSEERKAREHDLSGAELLAWRQKRIAPIAAEFKTWITDNLDALLPSNPVRKAMQYYLNHWEALTRFLLDPDVPLDNNWSERALRVVNLIRNNSLYAGGEDGAVRLCTLLTLVHTCRLLQVDPYAYLEWALSRVVPHRSNRGLTPADLTPAAYKATQEREAR